MRSRPFYNSIKRFSAKLLCVIMAAFVVPFAAHAQEQPAQEQEPGNTVRVGWYESPFNVTDQFGRRSGYAYEYQQEIAAYTGWEYEYVEGSWPELMQMLANGDIDLLSDVSYTEERAQRVLYSDRSMGTEQYFVYVSPDNAEIRPDDLSTLNGKRVGVDKGSIQADFYREWAKSHDVQANLVELALPLEDVLDMLRSGELDAYIMMDSFGDPETAVPVFKVGASDFYFAVSKNRPDLVGELNVALNQIQTENPYFNQQMYAQAFKSDSANLTFSAEEKAWLEDHGAIRIGYQDNYLAFCATDEAGELTGALKDFLEYISENFVNEHIRFETVAFPTASDAMEALAAGDIDCVFPANLTAYDAETLGVVMTPALMTSEMDAVVRAENQKEFIRQEHVVVAVNEGNTNYERFLVDHFPGWEIKYFPDTPAGLEAIAAGEADCVIVSNYRFGNIEKQCDDLHLATVYTGVNMDYYLAARRGETQLYSILAKTISAVPDSVVHAALTYYSTEDAKTSVGDFIKDNLTIILGVIAAVLLVILVLLLISIRAQRKAAREQRLAEDLSERAYVDALTHVRNKRSFAEFAGGLQERLDQGERLEFAIGVFDCDNLKATNDRYGHDKGDVYLTTASRLICRVFQHSPVFRIGGDEFAAVLMNEDYRSREALVRLFAEEQAAVNASSENEWEHASIAMGIAVYDPQADETVDDTLHRADKLMYDDKRARKGNAKST